MCCGRGWFGGSSRGWAPGGGGGFGYLDGLTGAGFGRSWFGLRASTGAGSWFACFYEHAGAVCHERAVGRDLVVELAQLRQVRGDGEVGDRPDHLAEEVDDGADVVELHAQPGGA